MWICSWTLYPSIDTSLLLLHTAFSVSKFLLSSYSIVLLMIPCFYNFSDELRDFLAVFGWIKRTTICSLMWRWLQGVCVYVRLQFSSLSPSSLSRLLLTLTLSMVFIQSSLFQKFLLCLITVSIQINLMCIFC